mgnify:CR=1 FL=1
MESINKQTLKDKIPWNKGKKTGYNSKQAEKVKGRKHTEEELKKMRGRKLSKEVLEKITTINRKLFAGKPLSEEHKKKISEAHKKSGHKWPSPLGKKKSDIAKEKMKIFHTGKRATTETKRKMSWSHLGKHDGEKHPNWKGGITPVNQQIRHSLEYHFWRSDCFGRDKFTCQECKIRNVRLVVDHIKPFAVIIAEYKITSLEEALNCEELWDINNGRTLCDDCHKQTSTYGNRKEYRILAKK